LKQVDIDAKFQYSAVRSILFSSSYQVIVSPNPAADFINVYVAKDNNKSYTVQLLDMSGRILKTATTVQPLTQFATAALTKGVYTVRITDGGNTTIKKVSVQ
jgi:Secretion system C-terminal sorting domain